VAVFDPTVLPSDDYEITVEAGDGAQTGGISFILASGTGNKPGRVQFATADAVLPVAGLPLSIGRSYDSFDALSGESSSGDFGPGWRLLLSASVRDTEPDLDPSASSSNPLAGAPFKTTTRVTVTKPNGEIVGFRFAPELKSFPAVFQYQVKFEPDPGVTDTLRAVDWPDTVFQLGSGFANFIIPYNPSRYELETEEGLVYVIDEFEGLIEIRDVLGGVLEVTADGIQSSWGVSVDYVRDDQGRIVEIILPQTSPLRDPPRLLYRYDANGNLVGATDAAGNESTFAYDNVDYPHHLTDLFDQLGNPIARHVFDEEGRMVAHCPGDANIATLEGCSLLEFDAANGVETIFDPRGFRSDLFYNDQGLLAVRRDWFDASNFIEQTWTYDDAGRVLIHVDGDGGITTRSYDEAGNEISATFPSGATWTWEYGACRDEWIQACDPLGNCLTQDLNERCQPTRFADPFGNAKTYRYDERGLMTQVIDELGQTRSFEYDERGLVTGIIDADGQRSSISYNAFGSTTKIIDRNGVVRDFVYDDAQRVIEERSPSTGLLAEYEYNAVGLPTRVISPESIVDLSYWPTGDLRRVDHQAPGTPSWWVEYQYDGSGNTVAVSDSLGGLTEYEYDGINRMLSVRQSGQGILPKRVDFESSAIGLPLRVMRYADLSGTAAGPVSEYFYNCLSCPGQLTRIEHRKSNGEVIEAIDYERNLASQVVAIDDEAGRHTFRFDGRGWLDEVAHPPTSGIPSGGIVWDAAGNWLTRPGQAAPAQLSYAVGENGHRLLADDQFDYLYTGAGQLFQRVRRADGQVMEMSRSPNQRIEAVELRDGSGQVLSSARYDHSALAWRVSAERDGERRYYLHDFDNPMVALDEQGQTLWRRLLTRNVDRPLAIERDEQIHWLLADHIGTVRKEVDNAGQELAAYRYDAFGQQVDGPLPTLDDALRYTGRDFDLPDGLGYYRARIYDARIARFLSEDPQPSWHYRYVDNNPLSFVDPSGELSALEWGVFLCGISGAFSTAWYTAQPIYQSFNNIVNALNGYAYTTRPIIPEPNPYDFFTCGLATPAGVSP
jgi:RHS repeat-associated protein